MKHSTRCSDDLVRLREGNGGGLFGEPWGRSMTSSGHISAGMMMMMGVSCYTRKVLQQKRDTSTIYWPQTPGARNLFTPCLFPFTSNGKGSSWILNYHGRKIAWSLRLGNCYKIRIHAVPAIKRACPDSRSNRLVRTWPASKMAAPA